MEKIPWKFDRFTLVPRYCYASFSRLGFANLFSWSKKEEFFNNSEELFKESQLLQDSRYLNKFLRIW